MGHPQRLGFRELPLVSLVPAVTWIGELPLIRRRRRYIFLGESALRDCVVAIMRRASGRLAGRLRRDRR